MSEGDGVPVIERNDISRIRRLLCLLLGDHGRDEPRRVVVGPQSPLGGRVFKCGRCGQTLAHYVNALDGRLDAR
jgi:hypothetical protein